MKGSRIIIPVLFPLSRPPPTPLQSSLLHDVPEIIPNIGPGAGRTQTPLGDAAAVAAAAAGGMGRIYPKSRGNYTRLGYLVTYAPANFGAHLKKLALRDARRLGKLRFTRLMCVSSRDWGEAFSGYFARGELRALSGMCI